ncbi:hypothetical protein [uncultured Jatrophihabitans sp.]|uniref:hypothetical protein n=1 Tax=uncultured Jatrophihabitans sp. TaxID=1610747 RepID=UPI0035C944B0
MRAKLPDLTVAVFFVFALCLWVNAVVYRFRFNVVLALIGSVPLLFLLARAIVIERADNGRGADLHGG